MAINILYWLSSIDCSRLYIWGSKMIDVQFIVGSLFTALIIGWAIGKQLLVFRQVVENIS